MTGSQWREVSRGFDVGMSGKGRSKTRRAAAFWICWRGLIADAERPAMRELQ